MFSVNCRCDMILIENMHSISINYVITIVNKVTIWTAAPGKPGQKPVQQGEIRSNAAFEGNSDPFRNSLREKCIFRKCIFRKFCNFWAGSFSAVSKRNFARKYAFDSIFQALQDLHPFAPLQSQNFRKKSV